MTTQLIDHRFLKIYYDYRSRCNLTAVCRILDRFTLNDNRSAGNQKTLFWSQWIWMTFARLCPFLWKRVWPLKNEMFYNILSSRTKLLYWWHPSVAITETYNQWSCPIIFSQWEKGIPCSWPITGLKTTHYHHLLQPLFHHGKHCFMIIAFFF